VLPVAASARVTLGIYSGRPDPAWELTKDETDKLVTFIDQMPPALGPAPQGGLGYHGFTVEITGVDGSIANVTAYAAVISIAGGVDRRKIDDGKHLERFLLETGRPTLTADEYTITKQALDDLLR
jgi:hypothetical protein